MVGLVPCDLVSKQGVMSSWYILVSHHNLLWIWIDKTKGNENRKKRKDGSWENLKGDGNRHQDGEWGTDERDGTRTGVSEWLPSDHLTTTSTWCVWTPVHAGVVTICSDQPVYYRYVVFGFVGRWKEGLVSMINRNFMRLLMMGVFSRVCFGVLGGMRESAVSDSGRRNWFFFWVCGIGNGKRRYHGPWSSSYVHFIPWPQTDQIYVFMFCVMSYNI